MFIQGAVCKVICDSGFYSFRDINGINQCFLSCPSVTFANNLVGSCIACTNNCLSCASETTCLTCGPGYALFESTCLATCP